MWLEMSQKGVLKIFKKKVSKSIKFKKEPPITLLKDKKNKIKYMPSRRQLAYGSFYLVVIK